MKNFFLLMLLLLNSNLIQAAQVKYDKCEGSTPLGGFSSGTQKFTVKAYAEEGRGESLIVLHINGEMEDTIFKTQLNESASGRTYTGRERFGSHIATLNIGCTAGGCLGELLTDLSGTKKSYKVSCLVDQVELPPPATAPGSNCKQHCH